MIESKIHPTAIVDNSAKLSEEVTIGAYAVIGKSVTIGKNSVIHNHAVVSSYVKMGEFNTVHPFAVIGGDPQDLKYPQNYGSRKSPRERTWVEIGDNNIFREGTTVNRGTSVNQITKIGSNCYFMNNCHVAHDCIIGNNCIFSAGSTLGGHVEVGNEVTLGGGTMVHQYCRIGSYAIVAALLCIRKDVIPFSLVGGNPIRHYCLNTIKLKRNGINQERLEILSKAFRLIRKKSNLDQLSKNDDINHLINWMNAKSERGIYNFV